MVVGQIDEALHPMMLAILVGGLEPGQLVPVTVLHGSADSLPLDGGLGGMLRWSNEPLDMMLTDPRSPVRRLPPDEQEWLHCTGAALLVPVVAQDTSLVAVIVLGERRSEEAYTDEDCAAPRQHRGADGAWLRRRAAAPPRQRPADLEKQTTQLVAPVATPMMECPRCGRCEDVTTRQLPARRDAAAARWPASHGPSTTSTGSSSCSAGAGWVRSIARGTCASIGSSR